MRRRFLLLLPIVLLSALAAAGWHMLVPRPDPQPLPPALIAAASPEGAALLAGAEAAADHPALLAAFQPQWLNSYCGVASSVAVLGASGRSVRQQGFFTPAAQEVRPRWRVALTGMTLDALGGLLAAHGGEVEVHHAAETTPDAFRQEVAANLARPGDYLIVNYDRQALGQVGAGHISPLAAWDADTGRVLVMDTAATRYPPAWVPVADLFAAMDTIDGESGLTRGWVVLRGLRP